MRISDWSSDVCSSDLWHLLMRLVGAVYPTFTYADDPPKWTTAGEPAELLRTRVHGRRAELWQEFERHAGAPHVLGRRFSALDLYVAVMIRWRPGPPWFKTYCPALYAVAEQAAGQPDVRKGLARNLDRTSTRPHHRHYSANRI